MLFEFHNASQIAFFQDLTDLKRAAIPSPVMKNAENKSFLFSKCDKLFPFCDGHGERFLNDDVLSCFQCFLCVVVMGLIRGIDNYQLNLRVGSKAGEFFYGRSEEHTSELQSLMRTSYAVFCLKKKINNLIQ